MNHLPEVNQLSIGERGNQQRPRSLSTVSCNRRNNLYVYLLVPNVDASNILVVSINLSLTGLKGHITFLSQNLRNMEQFPPHHDHGGSLLSYYKEGGNVKLADALLEEVNTTCVQIL